MTWDRCEWLILGLMLLVLPVVLVPYWGKTLSVVEPPRAAAIHPAAAAPAAKSETEAAPRAEADDVRDSLASAPYQVLTYQPAADRDPMVSETELLSLTPRRDPEAEPARAVRVRRPRRAQAANLTIQAIMGIGGDYSAIVNDRPVRVGDTVAGARVVRIRLDRVDFVQGGRRFVKEFR